MKSELIVALDVSGTKEALAFVDRLGNDVSFYKVGLELFSAVGPSVIEQIRARKKRVFLDLKLHDIPRTVGRTVKVAAQYGVEMLTLHASGGRAMIRAAVEAARECVRTPPKLIAVTALTSLDQQDLNDLGIARPANVHVMALADLSIRSGAHGLVCSPQEVEGLRTRFGQAPILVTPGIRMSGKDPEDQKRVATPGMAAKAGSSFLVVGRPILEAPDPLAAAKTILGEIARAAV